MTLRTLRAALAGALLMVLAAPGAQAQPEVQAQVKRLLAKFNFEPTVVEVQNAAARYARVNPDAYDSWKTEARVAHLLPRRLRAAYQFDKEKESSVRTTSSTSSLSDLQQEIDEDRIFVFGEWDLSKVVFSNDVVRAARQTERLVNQREDILTTVNKLYFARRQLQVERELSPPDSVQRAIRQQLRIDGLTADLDALTGGWFSKQIARSTKKKAPARKK